MQPLQSNAAASSAMAAPLDGTRRAQVGMTGSAAAPVVLAEEPSSSLALIIGISVAAAVLLCLGFAVALVICFLSTSKKTNSQRGGVARMDDDSYIIAPHPQQVYGENENAEDDDGYMRDVPTPSTTKYLYA